MKKKNDSKEKKGTFGNEFVWDLLYKQDNRCSLSGRKLNMFTVEIELKDPWKTKNRKSPKNHYAVTRALGLLARNYTEKQIIQLAFDIVKYRGEEFGWKITKK